MCLNQISLLSSFLAHCRLMTPPPSAPLCPPTSTGDSYTYATEPAQPELAAHGHPPRQDRAVGRNGGGNDGNGNGDGDGNGGDGSFRPLVDIYSGIILPA
jgi:hypothetical protein